MDSTKEESPTVIITMDEISNDIKPRKGRMKSYASRVFQESTIGMVASIASSHSRARRCLKSLLLTLCLSGFLYQCTTYIQHVFDYPTVMDVGIQTSDEAGIPTPAYTFCINNGIKRSIFCDLYPDRCYEPSEKFCSHLQGYCGKNKTRVPMKDYYAIESTMEFVDILKWARNMSDFVKSYSASEDDKEGPFLRLKDEKELKGSTICYTLNSVVHNQRIPYQLRSSPVTILGGRPFDSFAFYVEEEEMFIPGSRPGVFFSIHSPYESVNPFREGIFLKPGRSYRIYVTMTQEVLLEEPFRTKCINYEELWKANNHNGPRTQVMCKEWCLSEYGLGCFNCSFPIILYPSDQRLCSKGDLEVPHCATDAVVNFDACMDQCRDDCRATKFKLEVKERYEIYPSDDDIDSLDVSHKTIAVDVFVDANEIMILKHSPKYMNVEVFSAIGGFIGCWLGISLMDITDFFGSIFMVISYACRRSRKK